MNTKIKKAIIGARTWVLGLAIGGCLCFSCVDNINFGNAFLEKAPGADTNIDSVFVKGENAKTFLWSLYGALRNPMTNSGRIGGTDPLEALTDLMHSYCSWGQSATRPFYSGTYTEANQESGGFNMFPFIEGYDGNAQKGIWVTIRKGWIFIENIDRVPDLSDTEKSQLKGEAYLIMATRYYDAFKHFGGLPLMDHSYIPGEQAPGRSTVEETVAFIDDKLIQKAIAEEGLPWRVADQDNWAGRLTKAGAYGLRAKLYQFAASPLFNSAAPYRKYDASENYKNELHSWMGGYKPEYWDKCLEACKDFFTMNTQNGGYFKLIQATSADEEGYRDAFRAGYWFRGNEEKIIEVHSAFKSGTWDGGTISVSVDFGAANPTLELMEMFPLADGKNYPYKNIYGTLNEANVDIMANRDPRMYETMVVTKQKPKGGINYLGIGDFNTVQMWQGGNIQSHPTVGGAWAVRYPTGMGNYKWVLENYNAIDVPFNFAYLRVADMHLTYAEALAETGDLSGALIEINKVRARVGLGRIEAMNPELNLTSNKDNLINEIMRERACEFSYEDSRFYDMVRRKMADKFTTPLHELITYRKGADGNKWNEDDYLLDDAGKPIENAVWTNQQGAWPNFIYEKRQIGDARAWWSPGGWDDKWFLSPLPRSEINKEYGLTQNPGW